MASLGMKCTSGSCLYEPDGPAPPAPVPHEHKTNLVRLVAAAASALVVQGFDPTQPRCATVPSICTGHIASA